MQAVIDPGSYRHSLVGRTVALVHGALAYRLQCPHLGWREETVRRESMHALKDQSASLLVPIVAPLVGRGYVVLWIGRFLTATSCWHIQRLLIALRTAVAVTSAHRFSSADPDSHHPLWSAPGL